MLSKNFLNFFKIHTHASFRHNDSPLLQHHTVETVSFGTYIGIVDDIARTDSDNKTIGLIICKEKKILWLSMQ